MQDDQSASLQVDPAAYPIWSWKEKSWLLHLDNASADNALGIRKYLAESIKRAMTTELKGFPEESFQQWIEAWLRRMRKYVRLEGNHFEGVTLLFGNEINCMLHKFRYFSDTLIYIYIYIYISTVLSWSGKYFGKHGAFFISFHPDIKRLIQRLERWSVGLI